jgi:hypothetical protein
MDSVVALGRKKVFEWQGVRKTALLLVCRLLEPLRDDNFSNSKLPGRQGWGPEIEGSAGVTQSS